jgi:pimeloyl-ACP methyl ester carboxylesterase
MSTVFQCAGVTLAYRDAGVGLPVVFLHPTPLDGEYWRPLTAKLSGVRAVVPDLRGHGGSELGQLPVGGFTLVPDVPVLTMAQLASDVFALLDHLKLPTAIFAGCSIGGYVLLEIWRQAPERVRGLVFICSKAQPDAASNLPRRAATIAQARTGKSSALLDGMALTLIGATALKKGLAVVSELRGRMTLTPQALVAVQAGLATRPDSLPTVPTITVPVMAIAGGEDSSAFPAEMDAFHDAPGGCDFHLLPDAGHFAAYEQPERVAAFFHEWLGRFSELA